MMMEKRKSSVHELQRQIWQNEKEEEQLSSLLPRDQAISSIDRLEGEYRVSCLRTDKLNLLDEIRNMKIGYLSASLDKHVLSLSNANFEANLQIDKGQLTEMTTQMTQIRQLFEEEKGKWEEERKTLLSQMTEIQRQVTAQPQKLIADLIADDPTVGKSINIREGEIPLAELVNTLQTVASSLKEKKHMLEKREKELSQMARTIQRSPAPLVNVNSSTRLENVNSTSSSTTTTTTAAAAAAATTTATATTTISTLPSSRPKRSIAKNDSKKSDAAETRLDVQETSKPVSGISKQKKERKSNHSQKKSVVKKIKQSKLSVESHSDDGMDEEVEKPAVITSVTKQSTSLTDKVLKEITPVKKSRVIVSSSPTSTADNVVTPPVNPRTRRQPAPAIHSTPRNNVLPTSYPTPKTASKLQQNENLLVSPEDTLKQTQIKTIEKTRTPAAANHLPAPVATNKKKTMEETLRERVEQMKQKAKVQTVVLKESQDTKKKPIAPARSAVASFDNIRQRLAQSKQALQNQKLEHKIIESPKQKTPSKGNGSSRKNSPKTPSKTRDMSITPSKILKSQAEARLMTDEILVQTKKRKLGLPGKTAFPSSDLHDERSDIDSDPLVPEVTRRPSGKGIRK